LEREQDGGLRRESLLDAPIHEVGDMGIFFGFSGAELTQSLLGHHLTQQTIQGFRGESHGNGETLLVLGEGHQMEGNDAFPGKTLKLRAGQGANELADPIGPEVETHQAIARLEQCGLESHGFQKLIAGVLAIGLSQHLLR
jgi:hypothetical protein